MKPEPLEHVIRKRDTFRHLWALLAPEDTFNDLYTICMQRWNRMTYREQQRMYWFLREKIRHGETIYKNPLYALTYTKPHPTNWNMRQGIDEMLRTKKMVSAFYEGRYGIYTLLESTIFEMTDIHRLN